MSFSGTPLGQGRRLDHNTFLGKQPSNANKATTIPVSYSYGAPTLASRSPTKNFSPTRTRTSQHTDEDEDEDENEPALARFARLKQREQASTRPGGPKVITSPPKPDKWAVKDTSVNIATAFTQAANEMQTINPNNSWASGSTRPNQTVPRSTSVEYEQGTQATTSRRLAPPPNRLSRNPPPRKPLSKTTSLRHVPDSEGEDDRSNVDNRGKSPFEQIIDVAQQLLAPAVIYARQRSRSHEPQEPSADQDTSHNSANGKDSSYDYAAEEQAFQAAQQKQRSSLASHKRGRISADNKAYKPTVSEGESSEEDWSDDEKTRRRRKKKKKDSIGGPLTSLPVISHDKRKKKRSRRPKGAGGEEEEEESESDELDQTEVQSQSTQLRASVPRSTGAPASRLSVQRTSIPPEPIQPGDESMSFAEQGLQSIPEVDENQLPEKKIQDFRSRSPTRSARARTRGQTPGPSFSIGGFLGRIVHFGAKCLMLFFQGISLITYLLGNVLGVAADILFRRPARWISSASPGFLATITRYCVVAGIMMIAWYVMQSSAVRSLLPAIALPSSATPRYTAPEVPAANIVELASRLQRIETALSGLSVDSERTRARADDGIRSYSELMGRLGSLESRLALESKRAVEAEVKANDLMSKTLGGVKQDMEVLEAQLRMQERERVKPDTSELNTSDEEARAKLKALEERLGGVEGGVKEALELGKKVAASPGATGGGAAAAWWHKLATGTAFKSGLKIHSADGQDVTAVIAHFVDSAVATYGKDTIARPDYALHSGGARVIPHLTSPTFDLMPPSLAMQLVGLVTGHGYAVGLPPATALHHELHNGYCWPFEGSQGQLGVALSAPIYPEAVTIDHVAREVAFDMRSAPRQMELWGMVEGSDNIEKVNAWKEDRRARRAALHEAQQQQGSVGDAVTEDDDPSYPLTLPERPEYIRIANFTYDINASNNVQTFPVDPEIQALGVDFGIVALRMLNNWGRKEFTCLYRFRMHGQRMGEVPPPYADEPVSI